MRRRTRNHVFGIEGGRITPFQGFTGAAAGPPGRCGGLSYHAPSVLSDAGGDCGKPREGGISKNDDALKGQDMKARGTAPGHEAGEFAKP